MFDNIAQILYDKINRILANVLKFSMIHHFIKEVLTMDTKKLAALLEVISVKSINKTSEKLGYTQSGLTYVLNTLNDELGVSLLDRNRNGVALSGNGEKLLPYIRAILDSEAVFNEQLHNIIKQASNKIRVGAYTSISSYWLPDAIRDFQNKYPDISIEVRVGSFDIPKWLENDEIDIAIAEKALAGDFDWLFLCDDEMCAAIPCSNPLSQHASVSLEEIVKYPLVFPSNNSKNVVTVNMQEHGLNFQNNVIISTSEGGSLLRMVGSGLGISFITKLYMPECPDTVKLLPITPPLTRPIGVIAKNRKGLPPQIHNFIRCLKEHDMVY